MRMQNVGSAERSTIRPGTKSKPQGSDFMDILNQRIQKESRYSSFDAKAEQPDGQKHVRKKADQSRAARETLEKSYEKNLDQAASKEAKKAGKQAEKKESDIRETGIQDSQEADPVQEAQKSGAVQTEQGQQEMAENDAKAVVKAGAQITGSQGFDLEGAGFAETSGGSSVLAGENGSGVSDGEILQTVQDRQTLTKADQELLEALNMAEKRQQDGTGLSPEPQEETGMPKQAGEQAVKDVQTSQAAGQTEGTMTKQTEGWNLEKTAGKPESTQAAGRQEHPGSTGGSAGEALKDQAGILKQMSGGNSVSQIQKTTEKAGKSANVEELQKYVDEQVFIDPGKLAARSLSGTYEAGQMKQTEAPKPVMEQFQTGLERGISQKLDTFTIRLKPEGLGEILIHMEHAGDRIAMSIGVTSEQTQKMLAGEMMNLKEMLRPLNAEVKEIYQSQTENFDMMTYQQNLSQQNRNLFYAGNNGGIRHYGSMQDEMPESREETKIPGIPGETAYTPGNWNAYV